MISSYSSLTLSSRSFKRRSHSMPTCFKVNSGCSLLVGETAPEDVSVKYGVLWWAWLLISRSVHIRPQCAYYYIIHPHLFETLQLTLGCNLWGCEHVLSDIQCCKLSNFHSITVVSPITNHCAPVSQCPITDQHFFVLNFKLSPWLYLQAMKSKISLP